MIAEMAESFPQNEPTQIFLDPKDTVGLSEYLYNIDFIEADERFIRLETIWETEMCITLRVFTPHRAFIIKQAKPYVDRYTHVVVSRERIFYEEEYYQLISKHDILKSYHL